MPRKKPVIAPSARQWLEETQFTGHGRIMCHACGKPLRDHKLTEPCPNLNLRAGQLKAMSPRQASQQRRRRSEDTDE